MKVLQLKNVPLYYGPRVDSVMTDKSNTTKEPTTNSNSGYRSTISGKDASSLKLELPYDDGNLLLTHSLTYLLTYLLTLLQITVMLNPPEIMGNHFVRQYCLP